MSMQNTAPAPEKRPSKRKRNFAILFLLLILIGAGCLAWYLLYARYYESTDDAYVNGNLINIFKGNTSPAEICKSLQMDTGAMSRMVERMVKSDLIERHPNPQDKRQVILALTAKGQTLCNTFQNEALKTILADLTARLTPEESHQLTELLIKMLPDEFTAPHR